MPIKNFPKVQKTRNGEYSNEIKPWNDIGDSKSTCNITTAFTIIDPINIIISESINEIAKQKHTSEQGPFYDANFPVFRGSSNTNIYVAYAETAHEKRAKNKRYYVDVIVVIREVVVVPDV